MGQCVKWVGVGRQKNDWGEGEGCGCRRALILVVSMDLVECCSRAPAFVRLADPLLVVAERLPLNFCRTLEDCWKTFVALPLWGMRAGLYRHTYESGGEGGLT